MARRYAISLRKLEEIFSIESFSDFIVNSVFVAGSSLRQINMRSSQTQNNALDKTRCGRLRHRDTEALGYSACLLFNDGQRLIGIRW